jgi:hypothetical protein
MAHQVFPDALIRKVFVFGEQATERRKSIIDALDKLHGQVEEIAHRPLEGAKAYLLRRAPEAAADVRGREVWVERLAVSAIAGTTTVHDFERSIGSYLLCWRRAMAAVDLWALTCRRCGELDPRVVVRRTAENSRGKRLCIPCWKSEESHHIACLADRQAQRNELARKAGEPWE